MTNGWLMLAVLLTALTMVVGQQQQQKKKKESSAVLDLPPPCDNDIYCMGNPGSLLHTVQMERIFPDSKTFVDMPMRHTPQLIRENYAKLISVRSTSPFRTTSSARKKSTHYQIPPDSS